MSRIRLIFIASLLLMLVVDLTDATRKSSRGRKNKGAEDEEEDEDEDDDQFDCYNCKGEGCENEQKEDCYMCFTVTTVNTTVIKSARGCIETEIEASNLEGGCKNGSRAGIEGLVCYCEGKLCNSASMSNLHGAAILIAIIAIILPANYL